MDREICTSWMPVDADKSMPSRIIAEGNMGGSNSCLQVWLCPSSETSIGRKIRK